MPKEGSSYTQRYLESCKKAIESTDLLICMGSEACDPDSFVCSIAMSMHEGAIPIVNMSRKIFESKEDLIYICSLFRISIDDLIFIEKPKGCFSLLARILGTVFKVGDKTEKLEGKTIKMILVDHHKPIEEFSHFELDTIIDHHTLSEASLGARRIYIDTDVGSCCTLISKFIGQSLVKKKFSKNVLFKDRGLRQEIAYMLTIPILLDTNKFKKVTSHFDRDEFKKLLKIAKMKKREIKMIVKTIKKVRRNDEALETDIILQKDYKSFEKNGIIFGYATVKYSIEKWVDREAAKCKSENDKSAGLVLDTQFNSFRREYGLDFLIVNLKLGSRRYLVCVNCPIERQLAKLQNFTQMNYKGLYFYEIAVEKTRKILAPVIKEMLHKLNFGQNRAI